MEQPSKKLDLISVTAIVLMAMSISLFDFEDWSWEINSKYYIGFVLAIILIIYRYSRNKRAQ